MQHSAENFVELSFVGLHFKESNIRANGKRLDKRGVSVKLCWRSEAGRMRLNAHQRGQGLI